MPDDSSHNQSRSRNAAPTSRRGFLYRATRDIIGVTAFSGLFALPGCGGGHSDKSKTTGSLTVSVAWPSSDTRSIPKSAKAIVVSVSVGSSTSYRQLTIVRPQTKATLTDVQPGTAKVTAKAYPNTDATGTVLATATVYNIVVVAGKSTALQTLRLGTTISAIEIISSAYSIKPHKTATLTAMAKDTNGAIVMVAPSVWQWNASNTSLATVAGSGSDNTATVTGVADGSVTVTVSDAEDSARTVTGALTLTVSSAATNYYVGVQDLSKGYVMTLYELDGTKVETTTLQAARPELFSGNGKYYLWTDYQGVGHMAAVGYSNVYNFANTMGSVNLNYDGSRMVWLERATASYEVVRCADVSWNGGTPTIGEPRTLSSGTRRHFYPVISADGSTVVYQNQIPSSGTLAVWTVSADGGAAVNVSGDGSISASSIRRPAISPRGDYVAWRSPMYLFQCRASGADREYHDTEVTPNSRSLAYLAEGLQLGVMVNNAWTVYTPTFETIFGTSGVVRPWTYFNGRDDIDDYRVPHSSQNGRWAVYAQRNGSGVLLHDCMVNAVSTVTTNTTAIDPILIARD